MTKFLKNVDVTGYVSQTSVTSSLVKTDANGKLVAAVAGTDYNAPNVTSVAGTLIREIRNTTGATLTKGTIVYISGATGNKPTVSKALATGDSTSAQTFGLCQTDIANNSNGNVVCVGDITGLDTSAFTEGAQLYLSSTTAGTYTTTKQLAPAHLVYIGVVTRSHPTQGQIEVKIQNGYELDEIHDVAISSKANNDGLFYESATSLWKNKSIATVLGYTPEPAVTAGTTAQYYRGDKTFQTLNTTAVAEGTNLYYTDGRVSANTDVAANTAARHSAVTLGTANGLSLSTQALSLGLASASANGALSSTDWTTFNNKQNALTNPVTGTGTTNYVTKFTGASTIGNSQIFDNGTFVGIGTTTQTNNFSFKVNGPILNYITPGGADRNSIVSSTGEQLDFVTYGSQPGQPYSNTIGIFKPSDANNKDFLLMAGNSNIRFVTGGYTEQMRIWNNGNVSINNTTDSGFKLDVTGTGRFSSTITATGNIKTFRTTGSGSYLQMNAESGVGTFESSNGYYYFNRTPGDYATPNLMIDGANNRVGIGTSSPNTKLTILNNGNAALAFTIKDTNANGSYLQFNASNTDTAIIADGTTGVPMDFYTGGNLRQRITSSGTIIASNNGQFRVERSGNFRVNNNADGLIGYFLRSGSWKGNTEDNLALATDGPYGISFFTNGSGAERMFISSAGNVIIGNGTTDAGFRLDVGTSGSGNNVRARRIYANGTGTDSGFSLNSTLIYQDSLGDFNITNPGSYPDIAFKIDTSSNIRTFSTIGAADDVRIGISNYDTTAMTNGVGGQLVLGYKYTSAGDYTQGAILKMYKENATSGEYGSGMKFQVRNTGTNLSTKMVLTPSGRLLVGFNSGSEDVGKILKVNGAVQGYITSGGANSSDRWTITDTNGNYNLDFVSYVAGGQPYSGTIGMFSNSRDLLLMAGSSNIRFVTGGYTENMRLWNGGNLALGNPGTDNGYRLQVGGSVIAVGYYESSDKKLKNITSSYLSDNFGAIEFNWKDERDVKNHWGYVAQEVQEFLPDAVNMGNDGFLSVDYNQAHTFKIAKVEDKVTLLEKRVAELEAQLNLN